MLTNDELHVLLDEATQHSIDIKNHCFCRTSFDTQDIHVLDDMFKRFVKSFYGVEIWENYFGD